MSNPVLRARRELAFGDGLASRDGWYHSMEFSDGTEIEGYTPFSVLRDRYADFGLPDNLEGKNALDIGAWDGWFSFEMESHGAEVTAVDIVAVRNFQIAHERKQSKARYIISDVYTLPRHGLGQFDYVLFLGVLYHLRHPLLALDIVCGLTREMAVIDSFVVDGDERAHIDSPLPFCEFYETDELGGHFDNWFGPTIECLLAFCRSAGFVRVKLLSVWHRHARVACYRHWDPPPSNPAIPAPQLLDAKHCQNFSVLFSTDKEEYLTYWFRCDSPTLQKDEVLPEVGGFAVPVLVLTRNEADVYMANVRIPPGLTPGPHAVRLRLSESGFSEERTIFLDTPLLAAQLVIHSVCDGVSWKQNAVSVTGGGHLTLWVTGLSSAADHLSVELYAGNERVPLAFVGATRPDGSRQLNGQLTPVFRPGPSTIYVREGAAASNFVQIEIEP